MTIQTPEQIAARVCEDNDLNRATIEAHHGEWIFGLIADAIKADRAQPIHPDWQDDAERWGQDGCDVQITDAYGDTTDFGLNAAEVLGMFNGIGRAEA